MRQRKNKGAYLGCWEPQLGDLQSSLLADGEYMAVEKGCDM